MTASIQTVDHWLDGVQTDDVPTFAERIADAHGQSEAADVYAAAMWCVAEDDVKFWRALNDAVRARWPRGLARVKALAWRRVQGAEAT